MRKILFILSIILTSTCFAQKTMQVEKLYDFPAKNTSSFTTDHLEYVYLIKGDEIQKRTTKGEFIASYSNPILGDISYVNTFNPLNILLLYREFNQITFIDNRLNTINQPITMTEFGFIDIQLASTIDESNIWIYDQALDKLVKWNTAQQSTIQQTLNITQLVNAENTPNYLVSDLNGLYLNVPEFGILVFDIFGNYKKLIPIKGLQSFQAKDNQLTYVENGTLKTFDLKTLQENKVKMPITNYDSYRVENNKLFIFHENIIEVYRIFQVNK